MEKEGVMRIATRPFRYIVLIIFALTGCHEAGRFDDPPVYGASGAEVSGEVISHNTQYNIIEISQRRGGTFAFVYDRGTRFDYRTKTTGLVGPGDDVVVALRNQRDDQGRPFASTITVRQNRYRR
jgi:hypothetical protein